MIYLCLIGLVNTALPTYLGQLYIHIIAAESPVTNTLVVVSNLQSHFQCVGLNGPCLHFVVTPV